jgi:glutamate synthase domain-containing protein 3
MDWSIIEDARAVIDGSAESISLDREIRNTARCVGGVLASAISDAQGAKGLPDDAIHVEFVGAAGQSFGGWLAPGVSFALHGEANDYTARAWWRCWPSCADGAAYVPEENV